MQRDLLVRGDAHIAANLTPDLAAAVQKNANIGVLNVPSLGFPWLAVHVNRNPALKNPKTWEAIKYAIDYDGLAKIYLGGGQPIASCIPPGLPNALPVEERIKTRSGACQGCAGGGGLCERICLRPDLCVRATVSEHRGEPDRGKGAGGFGGRRHYRKPAAGSLDPGAD